MEAVLEAGDRPGTIILTLRVTEIDYAKIFTLVDRIRNLAYQIRNEESSSTEHINEYIKNLDALIKFGTPGAIAISLDTVEIEVTALPILLAGLKNSEPEVRSSAALILGKIGLGAKVAIPELTASLNCCDECCDEEELELRNYVVSALRKIAISLYEESDSLSLVELTQSISDLDKSLKILKDPKNKFSREQIANVNLPLQVLKEKLYKRLLTQEILKNPWVWVTGVYLISLFGFFWLRPLWLFRIYELLKPVGIKVPIFGIEFSLGLLLFLKYHPRVLDAWVACHINSVKEEFGSKDSVHARQIHIPTPVMLEDNTVADLKVHDLRPKFHKKRVCLLIWGEGGIGKTSLACQIAKWALADNKTERLCEHKIIPVLIETELDSNNEAIKSPLVAAIQCQLQDLTNEPNPISEELLERLLRERRILVIIDHFSEMSEATRKEISKLSDFPVNALVVTSRLEDELPQVTKTVLKPLRIKGNCLLIFMQSYLAQRGKLHYFTDAEVFYACSQLSKMIGITGDITALFAKLYAEQLIATKERKEANKLPNNIPNLILFYINEINRNVISNKLSNRVVHQDAKVLAWECLKKTYRPTDIFIEDAFDAMGGNNTEFRFNYLKDRLGLIQIKPFAEDKIRFTLDPLAEYLAGLHLVNLYGTNENAWRELLTQTAATSGEPTAIQGFLLALLDCYYFYVEEMQVQGEEMQVPDFVLTELRKQAGL